MSSPKNKKISNKKCKYFVTYLHQMDVHMLEVYYIGMTLGKENFCDLQFWNNF